MEFKVKAYTHASYEKVIKFTDTEWENICEQGLDDGDELAELITELIVEDEDNWKTIDYDIYIKELTPRLRVGE